jgi:hypothetical protein
VALSLVASFSRTFSVVSVSHKITFLLEKLADKGIEKFIAYEIPIGLAQQRYGAHFTVVRGDLRETDDLRVLDEDGERAFKLFRFEQLIPPLVHERPDS